MKKVIFYLIDGDNLSYYKETADVLELKQDHHNLDFHSSFDTTFNTIYPDSLWQCFQLMKSSRAGDVVISAAIGYDLRDFYEYPKHKGSHGSLHWEHIHVPILTNQKDHINNPMRTTQVHGVIKKWLNDG